MILNEALKEFEEIIFTSAGVTELFVGATDSSFAHRRFNGGKALFNVLWNNLKSFPTAHYFSRPLFSLTIFHHYFLHLPSIYIFSVLFLCVWSLLYTWWSAEQTQAMKCVWMLVFVSLILLLLFLHSKHSSTLATFVQIVIFISVYSLVEFNFFHSQNLFHFDISRSECSSIHFYRCDIYLFRLADAFSSSLSHSCCMKICFVLFWCC